MTKRDWWIFRALNPVGKFLDSELGEIVACTVFGSAILAGVVVGICLIVRGG